jgi:hypothetical protein
VTTKLPPSNVRQMPLAKPRATSRFAVQSDIPKFASSNRQAGTAEENKAVVQGSIAYFGTYSVSNRAKTFTVHIEGTTFPNWIGTDQKRPFTISGGELKWTTPITSLGSGTAVDVWKRAK